MVSWGGGDITTEFLSKEAWEFVQSRPCTCRQHPPGLNDPHSGKESFIPKCNVAYFYPPSVCTSGKGRGGLAEHVGAVLVPHTSGAASSVGEERPHLELELFKGQPLWLIYRSHSNGCSFRVGQRVCIYGTSKASLGPYHFGTDVVPWAIEGANASSVF